MSPHLIAFHVIHLQALQRDAHFTPNANLPKYRYPPMRGGMYQAIEHGKFALRLNKYIHFHGNFIKAIPGKIRLNLCRDIRVFFPFCRCPNAVQPNRFRHFGRHLRHC